VQKALVSVIRAQVANMEQKTVHRPSMVVTIAMLVNHRQRLGPVLRPFVLIALLDCTTLKQAKEHVRPVWLVRHPPPSVLPLRPSVKAVLQVCIARKPVLVRAKVVAPACMAQKLVRPLLLVVKNV